MIAHYTAVADNSPIPVILYSVPVYTGIDLTPKAIETLAAHPNIIGMKDSGGDVAKLASLVHNTKAHNFKMLVGSASILLPGYLAGRSSSIFKYINICFNMSLVLGRPISRDIFWVKNWTQILY